MVRFRYTAWDGSQRVRLDPEQVFARLAEYLSEADDLGEALDRLLREGLSGEEFEVLGVDDLVAKLRAELQRLYDTHNLDHALDRHDERLEGLLDDEREALDALEDEGERSHRSNFLSRLPRALDEAMDRLAHYSFASRDARSEFEALGERHDDIHRVADFVRRNGQAFRGRESLDFEATLELIARIEALKKLEEMLFNGDFDRIDLDQVSVAFGDDIAGGIANLRRMLTVLADAGYVISKSGKTVLSPKGARKLGQLALREIHRSLLYDATGRHSTERKGPMEIDVESTKPYHFGDPFDLNAGATVANAVRRDPRLPVRLEPADLVVHEATYTTRNATVLLLDMSWSMSWEGRFAAAKKVALAMDCLMRTRYPRDFFAIVGFYTRAVALTPRDLPEVTWNMGDPFTNLQDGLRVACRMLDEQAGANKSMIVITDGQPTAYFSGGRLFCEWPMSLGGLSTKATLETLKEVERVTRRGVVINTFMLDDSPPLRAFVEKMTRMNKGRAFYTTPDQLGRFVLVDYVGRRRRVL
jgi:uncharacterized protein with von Willebrand factor type A (vWA) domain